ncbi:MAG: hypothetical protein AAFR71_05975 [Pseudomonadota bacterium]
MADRHNQVKYLKVYGERNTGTNFVEQLILYNAPDLIPLSKRPPFKPKGWARQFPLAARNMAYQRIVDFRRRQEFPDHLGWKHAYTMADEQRNFAHFDETLFIFIVRNPYYFISSLYRRAYDITPRPGWSKARFVRQPILLNERDNVSWTVTVRGPGELWSIKTKSYVETASQIEQAILIRYEDLVADPDHFVRQLSEKGLTLPKDYQVPHKSTKGDRRTFDDYAKRARTYNPGKDFSRKLLDEIDEQLDAELLKQLGYTYTA